MERVQGVGGVFLRARQSEVLAAFYRDALGMELLPWGGCAFRWSEQHAAADASTIFSLFAPDSDYFGDRAQAVMLNLRVVDLDAMLAQVRACGGAVEERVEDSEYGRFGWVTDPEGNRVELWQPPEGGGPKG